jgi:hypothetical protein
LRVNARAKNEGRKTAALKVVTAIGWGMAAVATLGIAALLVFLSRVITVRSYETEVVVPGGFFALTPTETTGLGLLIAAPGMLLLLALCFIGTGTVMQGRIQVGDPTYGGSVVAHNAYLPLPIHLRWIGVAVIAWAVLVPVPVLSALAGGWPTDVNDEPSDYIWATLGTYGAIAAAIAGVLIASYVKKRRHLALVAADDPRLSQKHPAQALWRWVTFRWRFDLWFAGIGGAVAGASLIALEDGALLVVAIGVPSGLLLFAIGIVLCRQYWKAARPLGTTESYS